MARRQISVLALAMLCAALALVTRADATVQDVRFDVCGTQQAPKRLVMKYGGAKACIGISRGVKRAFFYVLPGVYDSKKNGHSAMNQWYVQQQSFPSHNWVRTNLGICLESFGYGWSDICRPQQTVKRWSNPKNGQRADYVQVFLRACDYELPTHDYIGCSQYGGTSQSWDTFDP